MVTNSRIRSTVRKAEWPSLQCQTGGIDAEGAKDSHAADPEQKLLAEPDFLVSTIEPRGESPIFRGVFGHIGIDQIEGHSSVAHLPHEHRDLAVADLDFDGAGDRRLASWPGGSVNRARLNGA